MEIGAIYKPDGICNFVVWGPFVKKLQLELRGKSAIDLSQDGSGYWRGTAEAIAPGQQYFYIFEGKKRPDPASNYQPDGVHGYSQVVDHSAFRWHDQLWESLPLDNFIIYEIHTGTFTPAGTFEAIIERLEDLKEIGITAIELMPVAQFPGRRNWGYDGACPFAVQNSYGGPEGLKKLVNACHLKGIAVILDVVYNHFGPEGAYFQEFGPYFNDKYRTPWGKAINFDDEYSDEVRKFFIENALHWLWHYHIDALRLDAVHAMYDFSAKPFLRQLSERINQLSLEKGRKLYLIAESDLNDVKIISPIERGGYGLDAQWCDDFHHCLHRMLTGESSGYYAAFGGTENMAKAYRDGFVYSGEYSTVRHRHYGSDSSNAGAKHFVVCSQNHDQVGNRMFGERLTTLIDFEGLKLCAAATILSPYLPLLFMGEEYGEESPFLYFIDHGDRELIEAVRQGRKEEFAAFDWNAEPPDPYSIETFNHSRIGWQKREHGSHRILLDYYKKLIELRKTMRALNLLDKRSMEVTADEEQEVLTIKRWNGQDKVLILLNFGRKADTDIRQKQKARLKKFAGDETTAVAEQGTAIIRILGTQGWAKILDSAASEWGGPGTLAGERIESGTTIELRPSSAVILGI